MHNKQNDTVLIITSNNFPHEDAGALRDECISYIYQQLGYKVEVLCKNREGKSGYYNGIAYHNIDVKGNKGISRQFYITKWLKSYIKKKQDEIAIIHVDDMPIVALLFVKKIARHCQIKVVYDCVEWYSPCEFKRGRLDKAYIFNSLYNRILINNQFRVISISSYLERYFNNKKIKTVRIPVVLNVNKRLENNDKEIIDVVYAGSPGRKDSLEIIIKAYLALDNSEKAKIHFHVIGVSSDQIVATGICSNECLEQFKNCLTIYGRIPHSQVIDVLETADFAVLLRPAHERFAKAGFPTKVVEAMSNSVAMICNYSSDLEMYLADGDNAIIVEDESVEAMTRAFIRVAALDGETISGLKKKAKNSADNFFNYRIYVDKLKKLIEE